ncbi:MAG TPA: adenylate/guanylate cyclase domain-containing protein [Cyanobacteria bacterium UBA11149]|nr:adenylate/guanylate cyclase domain-containing protein [Cyanobacteria bacterium UBA11367]HBE60564.1 adenylate/guanylate cyclase domain-containing protein [Cyanobacteria bacterium UBA11366]HBK63794.1 adenylate/guanylate cyclase domain-containing protein [Cyanobacteria bacterium UBA11166]HBS69013.1 adenylate/guanylate cyclase domain-containing protein [Cyanobacteria bacterium UBA11153]HBW89582.1 adenylate/guanylate cyclase domain-containing protein [Cyanobacteria bacterium UBA11149]
MRTFLVSLPPSQSSEKRLEAVLNYKLNGTRLNAFLNEFLSNSGHFLIFATITELTLYGWFKYVTDLATYFLIVAMILQSWYLSRSTSHRFWGNLIGVTTYTLVDIWIDKLAFFAELNHYVLWIFSLVIATLQGIRYHWSKTAANWIIPLESLTRTLLVVAFLVAVRLNQDGEMINLAQIWHYRANAADKFLIGSMLFLGLLLGLQRLQITRQEEQLKATTQVLRNLAEWGMGSYVVNTAITNPKDLSFQRRDRTILFMDIRGFTSWCEQTSPDLVAAVLNHYYRSVEPVAAEYQPLRITFTADEIMAIYATPQQGIFAALSMQNVAKKTLAPYGIGTGCAVHAGNVIEGLFGSEGVRTYTVIGDVVNTAKRLEGATPAGEITISDTVYQEMRDRLTVEPCEPITAKGKKETLKAWRLVDIALVEGWGK